MKQKLTDCLKLFFSKPALRSCVAQKVTHGKIVFKNTKFYKNLYRKYLNFLYPQNIFKLNLGTILDALLNVYTKDPNFSETSLLSTLGDIINNASSWKNPIIEERENSEADPVKVQND